MSGSFDLDGFLRLVGTIGHGKALGYTYVGRDGDHVEMTLEPKAELVGDTERDILASGAITGLLDACGGAAVWHQIGEFKPVVTIDLRLDYLRPATLADGTVTARCECYKLTPSVAFVRGTARLANEAILAHVAATYMVSA